VTAVRARVRERLSWSWERRHRAAALLLVALAGVACREASVAPVSPPRVDRLLPRDTQVVEDRVPRGATLVTLLGAHGVSRAVAAAVGDAVRPLVDPRRLRAGQPYRLVLGRDGSIRRFDYEVDGERYVEVEARDALGGPGSYAACLRPIVYETAVVARRVVIDALRPSLVAALAGAGEGVALAVALADLLAGEVDFNSDLQPGDTLRVVFERRLRDGRPPAYGAVLAAELTNGGRRIRAFRFVGPDGRPGYYDAEGRSLRRFFLASPLPFQPRVTSRFSRRRLHPIVRVARPHLGVDYAAPLGTPVRAVADGTVVSAADNGEAGLMVHLRHPQGYESFYLHLASVAPGLRPGARVGQGQVIGRVGASGLATGPHLDYRLRRHGVFVNPLAAHRAMPPGDPLPPALRAHFAATRDRLQAALDGASLAGMPGTARAEGGRP
jgi:murein DD-endopeptidase MepM/ murein hydrolase activator NlpD